MTVNKIIEPFELAVRIHLSEGVSLKWLLLDEGEPFPDKVDPTTQPAYSKPLEEIEYFVLSNGKLVDNEKLTFDKNYLDKTGITNAIAIESDQYTYIIDKDTNQAVSDTDLVDMDGLVSLNDIQRLPGKKLTISFSGSTLTIREDEVKVVGKVDLVRREI